MSAAIPKRAALFRADSAFFAIQTISPRTDNCTAMNGGGGGNGAGGSRATWTKPVRVSFRVESESIEPACGAKAPLSTKPERDFEAGAGIEPANSGFADRDLTTWLPRRLAKADNIVVAALVSTRESFRSQAPSIETHVLAATTASAPGQRFNASTNPVIVSG